MVEKIGKNLIKSIFHQIKQDIQIAQEYATKITQTHGKAEGLKEAESIINKALTKIQSSTHQIILSNNDFTQEGKEHLWRYLQLKHEDDMKKFDRIFLHIVGAEVGLKLNDESETTVYAVIGEQGLKLIGKI